MLRDGVYQKLMLGQVSGISKEEQNYLLDLVFNASQDIKKRPSINEDLVSFKVESIYGLSLFMIKEFSPYTNVVSLSNDFIKEFTSEYSSRIPNDIAVEILESILKDSPIHLSLHKFAKLIESVSSDKIIGKTFILNVKTREVSLK